MHVAGDTLPSPDPLRSRELAEVVISASRVPESIRGFANTTNVRFVQLVDGRDNQTPHIIAPIASALAPSDLDIQRVEVVPGAASALYGMNALNGLVSSIRPA